MTVPHISKKAGVWTGSDDLAASLSTLNLSTDSKTMHMDSSNPPTPDGTGRPVNFQVIAPGLYRSSYPQYAHFEKLGELKLKTIVTLVPGTLPETYQKFISDAGIVHHHIPILANKDPEVYTSDEVVYTVLEIMLNQSNYPMMIHCNKGKHRTGCITASFRRVTGWTFEACIDEYERFSKPKDRVLDKPSSNASILFLSSISPFRTALSAVSTDNLSSVPRTTPATPLPLWILFIPQPKTRPMTILRESAIRWTRSGRLLRSAAAA